MTEHGDTSATVATGSPRLRRVVMYGIAGLLLLGAVVVQLIAPEGADAGFGPEVKGRGCGWVAV